MLLNNLVTLDAGATVGLSGFWSWVQTQGQYAIWIAIVYLAGKEFFGHKYGKMAIVIVAGAAILVIINGPDAVLTPVQNLVKTMIGAK